MTANVSRLDGEQKDLQAEVASTSTRAPSDRKDKAIFTSLKKGVDRLKVNTGDATQWKDWRFKTSSWLAQYSPSFETLMTKLDKSDLEPQEPGEGQKIMAGPEELTTDGEWCSEQLYMLPVQKCDGPALAIVRNLNTHGKGTMPCCVVPDSPRC